MRVFSLFSFLMLTAILTAQSTCQVSFFLESTDLEKDQSRVCLNIEVKDFRNILSFVLPVSFPSDVLRFTGTMNEAYNDIVIIDDSPGMLLLQWEELGGFGTQNGLEDGSVLLTLCFEVVDIPQDEFLIQFSDETGASLAIVTNTEPFILDECLFDGFISVPCSRSGLSWHDETFSRAGDGCFFSSSIVVWGRNHLDLSLIHISEPTRPY